MNQVFEDRRGQLIHHALVAGMDMLMVYDPVNLLYFTGIKITPYERFIALLLDVRSGAGQLVLPSLERDAARDSGISTEFYSDQDDPFAPVVDFLGADRLLGVEESSVPLAIAQKILTCPKTRLADISSMISDLRLLKDPTEIENLSLAARHSDEILNKISGKIHVGQTEKEITMEIMQAIAGQPDVSINDVVIQVLAGTGSADPHGYASDRTLKKGDPVTIDFGVCCRHYWSDCTRTFFAGPPKPPFKEIYETVLKAQQEAIDTVRPGVTPAKVDLAAREIISRAGFGEYFIHRTGHGIGLSIHEAPSLHSQNQTNLAQGMVVTIEPGIYIPGLGGIRIEEDVVVTADGANVLTRYPRSYADMVL